MLWFDGPIKNAVDKVKTSGGKLLVFVQGKDELTKEYDFFLRKQTKLQAHNCVGIKISDASLAFQQFKEIYITVPVPSLFFIKSNGVLIKMVSSKDTSDISRAINDIFEKKKAHKIKKAEPEEKNSLGKERNSNILSGQENSIVGTTSKSSYAKNIGYKLFDITEGEIRKRLNEIRAFPRFLLIDNNTLSHSCSFSNSVSKIQSARIQFRLPNDEVPSWEFPNLSTLGDVRAYLMEKMNLSPNFKLLRAFPRTCFMPEDEQKTLVDLSLTPNSTLIVVPVQDKTVQAKVKSITVQQNIASLVVRTLLQPFLIFINYFKKHVLKIQDKDNNTELSRLTSDTSIGKILNKKTSTSNIHDGV